MQPEFFFNNPILSRGTELRCDANFASNKKKAGMNKSKNKRKDMRFVATI
jgi:hypothetical protein